MKVCVCVSSSLPVCAHVGPHYCVFVLHAGDTFGFRSDVTLIGPKGHRVQVERSSCGRHVCA